MPRGGGMQVASVIEAQSLRPKMAQRIDAQRKAPIAPTPEHWLSEPNRYDWPGVDTPQQKTETPRPIYRLRKPIGNMTDEELEDYKAKLDKIWERKNFSGRSNPVYEKIFDQREQVIDERAARKRNKEEMLLQMARSEQLHFDNTPDENPFPFEWGRTDPRHDKLNPYVKAKQATKNLMEVREEAGYGSLNRDQAFKDFLEYYKKPWEQQNKEERPYEEYFQTGYQADRMKPTVENWVESKAGTDGKANIYAVLDETGNLKDRPAAKAALNRLIKEKGWIKDGEWIKVRENTVAKPNVDGLVKLDNLGAFTRSRKGETSEATLVNLDGKGKAKVKFMDPTRISMFDGEVDLSGLPGIKDHKGERAIRFEGGSEAALTNPSFGYTNKFGDIIFKKTGVKSVHTEYEGSRWDKENARKVETKVTKDFKVNIHPIDPKNRAEYEPDLPSPKFDTPFEIHIPAKDLLDLTAPAKYTKRSENKSKWDPKDYTEVIGLYTKNGKTVIVRRAPRENEEDKTRHKWKQVETTKAEGNGRAYYNVNYLRNIAQAAAPNEKIKISYNTDMPLKAEVNNPTVKGSFYLAPRVAID